MAGRGNGDRGAAGALDGLVEWLGDLVRGALDGLAPQHDPVPVPVRPDRRPDPRR